jgi:hypothetical protein
MEGKEEPVGLGGPRSEGVRQYTSIKSSIIIGVLYSIHLDNTFRYRLSELHDLLHFGRLRFQGGIRRETTCMPQRLSQRPIHQ